MIEKSSHKLKRTDLNLFPDSLTTSNGIEYGLVKPPGRERLVVLAKRGATELAAFEGQISEIGEQVLLRGSLSPHNAAALRSQLPHLQPVLTGIRTSAGMGDRLGLATPGHVRAVRATGSQVIPIFAQQSMREMARTGRTPQQVMDDATWGIFQEGWREGVGADADHLKTQADIDLGLSAGFSFFTIDPGEYVDDRAEVAGHGELVEMIAHLPPNLHPRASSLLGKSYQIQGHRVHFDEAALYKAAVKYGRAVDHVAGLFQHLINNAGQHPFELEVSVDETSYPTSHAEHIYIASELRRLGVKWVSLAPRFVGQFNKGVDYIGDLAAFEADLAGHADIARQFGPYKLSLHSGSDKFSIYPAAARLTGGLVHLKTAGTSYLEALRTLATLDPDLLRQIYIYARERYPTDRASYHVSGELERAPLPAEVSDWAALLDQFDARQILHVTFGSVLTALTSSGERRFYPRLVAVLEANPEIYAANLQAHFERHLRPFIQN